MSMCSCVVTTCNRFVVCSGMCNVAHIFFHNCGTSCNYGWFNVAQQLLLFYIPFVYFSSSSDGMSRSGVFITCMSEIERVKVEGDVDIFQTVKAARAQRPHMVYTTVSYRRSAFCT